ncbi:MAG TPA: aquaporin [Vicinamibacterales bacterium]|nr:aquaporin [Vicinamibacterales bacterium]
MRRKWSLYGCEFAGTALMLFIGVAAVALMWGSGSPIPEIPNPVLRRLVTGLLFAGGATIVVYSPLGQRSGGHINPAVTLAFWALGKFPGDQVLPYVIAQVLGAIAGVAAAAVLFGDLVRSVQFAVTMPGEGWTWMSALVAEALATFGLVFLIFVCVNKPAIAGKTGIIAGAFVVALVTIEAPVSGTSVNPARSAAPALFVPVFRDQWIYTVGPIVGALIAALAYKQQWGSGTVCAKLYHTPKYPCPFDTCGYRLVGAGEAVMREGEAGDEAYLVERGRLHVTRGGVPLAELGPGAWVGEMSLLLDEPRSATVTAATDAQLRRVTRDSFGRLLAEDPRRTQELLRQLAARVREASGRVVRGA